MKTPLDMLPFPVICASCGAGPFDDADAVDGHITEEHLPEAVWAFAYDHMPPAPLWYGQPKRTLTQAAKIARGKLEPPKVPIQFDGEPHDKAGE